MSVTRKKVLKELGLTLFDWGQNQFLFDSFRLAKKVRNILARNALSSPLDWEFKDWARHYYSAQGDVLWTERLGSNIGSCYFPQTLYIDPKHFGEDDIAVVANEERFQPEALVTEGGLSYYQTLDALLFDGEVARVSNWDPDGKRLTFQKTSYFDYLATNLSLDARHGGNLPDGTLRGQLHHDQKVGALGDSKLANATGINGLVFSSDGQMIYQVRSSKVLIHPGQLCSGFSGTVVWDDITRVMDRGSVPTLSELDVMREMTEELGVSRDPRENEVCDGAQFLGLTGELVRGGAPELFYSVDLNLPAKEILARVGRDREGEIKQVHWGLYSKTSLAERQKKRLPAAFGKMLSELAKNNRGLSLSIPSLLSG